MAAGIEIEVALGNKRRIQRYATRFQTLAKARKPFVAGTVARVALDEGDALVAQIEQVFGDRAGGVPVASANGTR